MPNVSSEPLELRVSGSPGDSGNQMLSFNEMVTLHCKHMRYLNKRYLCFQKRTHTFKKRKTEKIHLSNFFDKALPVTIILYLSSLPLLLAGLHWCLTRHYYPPSTCVYDHHTNSVVSRIDGGIMLLFLVRWFQLLA